MQDDTGGTLGHRPILALIVIAAAVLRFAVADHSLWFDEQASAFFSDQPFARLWSDWMLRETNPPLYYSILRGWRAVAGSSDLAIRALSVLASLLSIVLVFAVARRVYGTAAGLVAAALVALSGQNLYFAEQARGYIFVLCAALVAIDALITLSSPDADTAARRRAATVYAAAATTAIYLHATMILFPALALVAVIATSPGRYIARPSSLLPLVLADVAVLIGAAWAIRQAVLQLLHHADNIAPIGLVGLSAIAGHSLATLFLAGGRGVLSIATGLAVLLLVVVFVANDRQREETRLLAMLGGLSLLVLASLGTAVPVFVPRTIFWMSAIPSILAAAALTRISPPVARRAALAVLAVGLALDTGRVVSRLEQEDWNTPVDVVARHPGALMLVQGEAMATLADGACRRRLGLARCPYPIVAVTDPADRFDSWGRGSFVGPKVPVGALYDGATRRTVFLFRKARYHDLPALLHQHGLGHGVPADGPALLGPLPASALR